MTNQTEDFLSHYGVKGMKWGVRRTQAQLNRARAARRERNDPNTPEGAVRAQRRSASKNRRLLEDGELDRLVSRLEKEKKLKNLVEEDLAPGRRASNAILSETGKKVMSAALGGAASYALYKAGGKFGASPNPMAPQDFFKPKKK